MKILIILITIFLSFLATGCEYPTQTQRDDLRVEDRYVQLEHIEVTVTVMNNLNSQPVRDANVTIIYNDTTGRVLWEDDNPKTTSVRTNNQGVAIVKISIWSRTYQINSEFAYDITKDKTVQIRVEQSDFHTINTARTYSTEYLRTRDSFDDRRYLMYAIEENATVYMSPK